MEKLNTYKKYLTRIEAMNLSRVSPDPVLFLKLFADIHFLLVLIDNIRKSFDRLNKALFGKLEEIKKKYKTFFEKANAVRRCQEHLDERINSGKYYGKSLHNDWSYEICGETVIIGPPAAKKLVELYRTLDSMLENIFPKKIREL